MKISGIITGNGSGKRPADEATRVGLRPHSAPALSDCATSTGNFPQPALRHASEKSAFRAVSGAVSEKTQKKSKKISQSLAESKICRTFALAIQHGVVVQLVRIPACHAGGRGFESRPYRKISKRMIAKPCKFTFTRLFLYSQPNNTISDMPDMPHLPFSAVAFSVAIS